MGLLLITGCTLPFGETQAEETKISVTDGIGVLEYQAVVNKMLSDTYNYILLSVRNNAGGSNAKNIEASLENVEPFSVYECSQEHGPSDVREIICNQFFEDSGKPYKTHKVNQMRPNEELQFFWNIKAPTDGEIVGMSFNHDVYYTLEYDYTSTVTQTIVTLSQQEYLQQSQEGPVTLSGQTISSPGEIKLESRIQQPLIFVEGEGTTEFNLEFEVSNEGSGIPKPGSTVLIAVKKDPLINVLSPTIAAGNGWTKYNTPITCELAGQINEVEDDRCNLYDTCLTGLTACQTDTSSCTTQCGNLNTALSGLGLTEKDCGALCPTVTTISQCGTVFNCNDPSIYYNKNKLTEMFDQAFPTLDFPEISQSIRNDLYLRVIDANQLTQSNFVITLPMVFDTSSVFEPQKILTVSAYISYKYLKEGSTSLSVYPRE